MCMIIDILSFYKMIMSNSSLSKCKVFDIKSHTNKIIYMYIEIYIPVSYNSDRSK